MLSAETNGEYQPSACQDHEGRLWFPTPMGAVVVDPRHTPAIDLPPRAILERVAADNEVLLSNLPGPSPGPSSGPTRLAPGRARVVEFRFSAPSFTAANRARFRYRLVGHDPDWREATSDRAAFYTDLRPAAYRFELTAANAYGAWQPNPATFAFTLTPRFTQTRAFPFLAGIGAVVAASAVFRWRLGWHRRTLRAENNALLAEERARIARDLHDDLGSALTGVAFELDVLDRPPARDIPGRLRAASSRMRGLAARMREVVWTANPQCDNVSSLALFLEQQAVPLLRAAGLNARLDFPDTLPHLPLDSHTRHQLVLCVREALHNVIRHAQATEATLRIATPSHRLRIEVVDNGLGFDPVRTHTGNGLSNLRTRLEHLGGSFTFLSSTGQGTIPMTPPSEGRAPASPHSQPRPTTTRGVL